MQKVRKRRLGDRRDARRVRDIDAMHAYMAFLMPRRCEAEVYINERIDVTALLDFIARRNEECPDCKTTLFHCVAAAVAKVVRMRPLMNRYVSGRRYYQRDEISLCFMIKRKFTDTAEEALMRLTAREGDTLSDYSERIVGEVRGIRSDQQTYDADRALRIAQKLPKWTMRLLMTVLRFLDARGWMPQSVTRMDPNYCSVLLTNLGSIRCGAIYHHLNNFGTNSVVVSIGEVRREAAIDAQGNPCAQKCLELGVTLDERIADGYYFAKSVRLLKYLLQHPSLLELPLEEEFLYEDA